MHLGILKFLHRLHGVLLGQGVLVSMPDTGYFVSQLLPDGILVGFDGVMSVKAFDWFPWSPSAP